MPVSEALLIDQMEYMAGVPDKFFELIVADPNYGIGAPNMSMGQNLNRKSETRNGVKRLLNCKEGVSTSLRKKKERKEKTIDWDNAPPSPEYFKEIFRVSKNQIIWGMNYFSLPPTKGILVWNKNQPWGAFSQCELAWTSFDIPAKLFTHSNRGGNNELDRLHPTEKPYYLYQFCLKHYAKPGDKIFDPGMGSGMSRIVAYDMGFDYYGCEIDPHYFRDAERRFIEHKKQPKLFSYEPPEIMQTELFT